MPWPTLAFVMAPNNIANEWRGMVSCAEIMSSDMRLGILLLIDLKKKMLWCNNDWVLREKGDCDLQNEDVKGPVPFLILTF